MYQVQYDICRALSEHILLLVLYWYSEYCIWHTAYQNFTYSSNVLPGTVLYSLLYDFMQEPIHQSIHLDRCGCIVHSSFMISTVSQMRLFDMYTSQPIVSLEHYSGFVIRVNKSSMFFIGM